MFLVKYDMQVLVLMATYNDWESIVLLLPRIDKELKSLNAYGKIVIIDDCSSSIEKCEKVGQLKYSNIYSVEVVELYRNLGHQRALATGMAYCSTLDPVDYIVVMDSDEEDDPTCIPKLIAACKSTNDIKVIFAERTERSEGVLFKFFYIIYQSLYKMLSGLKISFGNYSVIPWRQLIRVVHIAELWSHYPGSIMKAKIPLASIPTKRGVRSVGTSRMNFSNLVLHAFGGFSVHVEIIATRILLLSVILGCVIVSCGVGVLGLRMFTNFAVIGWTSQILMLLIILVFQMAVAAMVLKFLVISIRMQYPMIPFYEYKKFVMSIREIMK